MCSPATAALEKMIQTNRSIQSPAAETDVSFVPTSDMTASTCDHFSMMNLEFPLIEWSSVAGKDENEGSFSHKNIPAMYGSDSSITTKADAHAFLDRFLAAETDDLSLRNNTIAYLRTNTSQCLPQSGTTKLDSVTAFPLETTNYVQSSHTNNKRRLVRSIALGSKLALLDTHMDIVGDKRFRLPITSCTYG
jgi:hypothetical protein